MQHSCVTPGGVCSIPELKIAFNFETERAVSQDQNYTRLHKLNMLTLDI